MKNNIPCEMIQDIMPVYIEKLTSEVTDKLVEEHLENCELCRRMYDSMTGVVRELQMSDEELLETKEDEIEFEFLKSQRKNEKRKIRKSIIITALVLLTVISIQLFGIGSVFDSNIMHYYVSEFKDYYVIGVSNLDSHQRVSHISARKDGDNLILTVRSTLSIRRNNEQTDYFYSPDSGESVDKIYMNGKLVWENGAEIECECGRHRSTH